MLRHAFLGREYLSLYLISARFVDSAVLCGDWTHIAVNLHSMHTKHREQVLSPSEPRHIHTVNDQRVRDVIWDTAYRRIIMHREATEQNPEHGI